MKKLLYATLGLSLLFTFSCKKETCDNAYALNFNEEGSCEYSTMVSINSVSIVNYPSTNGQGNPWPTEDVHVSITDGSFDTLFVSSTVPNSTSLPISWPINPVVNFEVTGLTPLIFIDMYGSQSGAMEYVLINLHDYTNGGSESQKYPTSILVEKSGYQFQIGLTWI
ncbi:MAG: hypothetical protein R2799_05160 [Crocinitomicaceae bacterium]